MRLYGILTSEDDYLYLYDTQKDLLESSFEEDGPNAGQSLIRIDAYTVLATGSDEKLG